MLALIVFTFFWIGAISVGFSLHNIPRDNIALIPSVSPTRSIAPSATPEAKKHAKHVNDFYKMYGWLEPGTLVPEKDLPKAIKKIQKVLKEPVTGVLSVDQIDMLNKPRCGTEQQYNATDANQPPDLHKRYVVWGPKWEKSTLTWKFLSYSSDVSVSVQQSTLSNAFAQWMNIVPLNIIPAASNARADIYVQFRSLGRDDTRYGFTSMVADGVSMSSGNINITFNEDYAWTDDRLFNFTAVHEIGHALGLSHSAVESAVMFAYYGGIIRPMHADDKMGVHTIYGWKNPRWNRIDSGTGTQSLIQVTTPASLYSTNDGLYQLRSSGQILRYSNGGWTTVDNYSGTVQITGSSGRLYQRHSDGSTWLWSGSGQSWNFIGQASENVIDIVAAADQLYSRRKDGWVTRYSGSGSSWVTIEQPTASVSKQIAITDDKTLWNLLTTGSLVRSLWPHSSGSWQIVDNNSANIAIAVGGNEFYKLQSDGYVVWLNLKEYYWQIIESSTSVAIYSQGDSLFSKHSDGTIWRYTGTANVWEQLDDRSGVSNVVGDRGGNVWELTSNGDVFRLVS